MPAQLAARRLGITSVDLSVVARDHSEEGRLARAIGGMPGAEIEDSHAAARLGEIWAEAVAAIAVLMPGIGPIVGAGPLGSELSEFAGHAAGGLASMLGRAGVPPLVADEWEAQVGNGAPLIGVHVRTGDPEVIVKALRQTGATSLFAAMAVGQGLDARLPGGEVG